MTSSCPGDLNEDSQVNLVDLAILLISYNSNARGDLDGDGDTDNDDLDILLMHYRQVCD